MKVSGVLPNIVLGLSSRDLPSYRNIADHDYEPEKYVSQPLMKFIENVPEDKIPLLEILPTIEGEGRYIGIPRTLMRVGGCAVGCHWCFPHNTKIRTAKGILYIYDIKPGDVVYSRDENGEVVTTSVEEVLEREVFETEICLVNVLSLVRKNEYVHESIPVTKEHPFMVERDSGTVEVAAKDLVSGDKLIGMRGMENSVPCSVESVSFDLDDVQSSIIGVKHKTLKVYNLKCSPHPTYYIQTRSGSDVLVHNCDTKYSWGLKGSDMLSIEEAVDRTHKHTTCREVSITGGEPLHYPKQLRKLCREFAKKGYAVNLETSGLIINYALFEEFNYISMDIKTPSSGVHLTDENLSHIHRVYKWHTGLQLKAVISNQEDLDWLYEKFEQILTGDGPAMILTPCADTTHNHPNTVDIARTVQMIRKWDNRYNIRIIPQIHKLLNFA